MEVYEGCQGQNMGGASKGDEVDMVQIIEQVGDVEYRESDRLTTVGGFLMTFGSQRRITMSTQLSTDEKERGIAYLLRCLADAPSHTQHVFLWGADDEENNG
jgi:hypothetical protein